MLGPSYTSYEASRQLLPAPSRPSVQTVADLQHSPPDAKEKNADVNLLSYNV